MSGSKGWGEPCVLLVASWGGRLPPWFFIGMVHPSASLRVVGYALFSIPPLLLLVYLVTQFPRPQQSLHIYPSLASVPRTNRVWEIYDEDYFPGGGYAVLPYGRVSHALVVRCGTSSHGSGTILAHGPRGRGKGELQSRCCRISLIPFTQVVLIPGLLLPAIIWKNVAPQLASHGFRVLLYGMQI